MGVVANNDPCRPRERPGSSSTTAWLVATNDGRRCHERYPSSVPTMGVVRMNDTRRHHQRYPSLVPTVPLVRSNGATWTRQETGQRREGSASPEPLREPFCHLFGIELERALARSVLLVETLSPRLTPTSPAAHHLPERPH